MRISFQNKSLSVGTVISRPAKWGIMSSYIERELTLTSAAKEHRTSLLRSTYAHKQYHSSSIMMVHRGTNAPCNIADTKPYTLHVRGIVCHPLAYTQSTGMKLCKQFKFYKHLLDIRATYSTYFHAYHKTHRVSQPLYTPTTNISRGCLEGNVSSNGSSFVRV